MTVDSTNLSLTYIQIDVYFPKEVHLKIRIYILQCIYLGRAVMRSEEKKLQFFP